MTRCLLAVAIFAAIAGAVVGLRPLEETGFASRKLLDINTGVVTAPFSLSAFGGGNSANSQCYLQGYPGSRADSTVTGPLNVEVPVGSSLTIYLTRSTDYYFQNYNYSGYTSQTQLVQNGTYGLVSITFSPTAAGQYVSVFSGYVKYTDPVTQPLCLVTINFRAADASPPPPRPSPPPPSSQCSGAIPCYCQNGYCFNNGATLSTSCQPPSGQSCSPVTTNPANIGIQYASGYPSTVNVCKCTSTNG